MPRQNKESIPFKLELLWDNYHQGIYVVAEEAHKRHIIPFCQERGWRFFAGNGDWWIGPPGEDSWFKEDHPEDGEWQTIAYILSMEITGMPSNDLGSIMPDYNPEENNETGT